MEPIRILVVDDEEAVGDVVAFYLKREGLVVERAADGESALAMARQGGFHLILLDVMMPRLDGFEVCRTLRAEGLDLPILFLTARAEEVDQVLGLGLGADDYIAKPFSGAALVARVKAHIRRYRELRGNKAETARGVLRFPGLEIDLDRCEVRARGQLVSLKAKEFELLRFFATNQRRVFTRGQIFRNVWGQDYLSDDNTVMVHIHRLREKIEEDPSDPRYIVTVRGLGYRFVGDPT
jgi:DNA-binding response OmpR family regulator